MQENCPIAYEKTLTLIPNFICNIAINKAKLENNNINPFPKLIDPIIMHQNLKDDYVSKLKSCLPSCPQLSSVTQNVG